MSKTLALPALLALTLAACGPAAESPAPATAPATSPAVPAAPISALDADTLRALDDYGAQAQSLVAAIDAGADGASLQAQGEALVATAAQVLPGFVAVKPHCKPYLDAALALRERWRELDAEAIEAGYHKDGALPAVADAAACYHMKDLIVHPITAMALLAQGPPDSAHAKHEIEEVIAHLSVVRATR